MNQPEHDVNALVDLATIHGEYWGDSYHHALAAEILRLRVMLAQYTTKGIIVQK